MIFFNKKDDFVPLYTLNIGINDNEKDFDEFFSKCLKNNTDFIEIGLDEKSLEIYGNIISEEVPKLLQYVYKKSAEKDISVKLSDRLMKIYENYDFQCQKFLPENPVKEKYFGCEEFLHTLSFTPSGIRHCMCMFPENAPPPIEVSEEHIPTAEEIVNIKNTLENERRSGNLQYDCENCQNIRFSHHNNQSYINKILIAHKYDCNADCSFCYNKLSGEEQINYDIVPCLKNLKPLLKYGFELHFGGGEATCWKEFDDICNFALEEHANFITLSTNGLIFSQKLAELIGAEIAYVTFSTDTANKATYKKMKNADFDIVTENIKKYVSYDVKTILRNKFIIIPEINDSEKEILDWIDYSVNLGIRSLALDIESSFFYKNRYQIPQKIKDLLNFAQNKIKERHCKLILYSFASQLLFDDEMQK